MTLRLCTLLVYALRPCSRRTSPGLAEKSQAEENRRVIATEADHYNVAPSAIQNPKTESMASE